MTVILTIIYSVILVFSLLYVWHRLLNRKIDLRDNKLYISLVGIIVISILNYFLVNKFIKITLITIAFMPFFKFLFNTKIKECIITPIYSQILVFFAELLYLVIYIALFGQYDDKALNTTIITFIGNCIIAIILVLLVQLKFVRAIYHKFIKITEKVGSKQLALFCLFGILFLNIFIMCSYYRIKYEYFIIINVSFISFALLLIIYSFKTQNNYNKVSDQYNVAKNSLRDYEDMMTKYRVANHENKNLLLTVRAMTVKNEKNIPEYIDSIIENKFEDDEKLLFEMSVIPTGGLRATIYSEILKIKEKKITYNLNIDRKISTIDLIELDTNTIIDICKIIGVFIDNSIEAVRRLKNRNINIDMYIVDKELCIKVSNNYRGNIDITRINEEGYTTKGKGHGYGLPLVKEIVKNNSLIETETEINKSVFSQILKIEY